MSVLLCTSRESIVDEKYPGHLLYAQMCPDLCPFFPLRHSFDALVIISARFSKLSAIWRHEESTLGALDQMRLSPS